MEQLLEIADLHVKYATDDATVYALNGVNLTINRGETLGLVGETGAGKTTTALSILRLLPQKIAIVGGGTIRLGNLEITKLTEADMRLLRGNRISMIFQDPMTSLNPVMTVGDQIAEVLETHNKEMTQKQISDRTEEILRMVNISSKRKDDYPHQFSGGMKQRIVIAIAIACQPELLIADEPTTALDVTIQGQVLSIMNDLKSKLDTSMLLITHDLGVVAQTCDRVAIMYAGQIIEIGTVEDIFNSKEHHPYTVGLFGSIPNLTKKTRRLQPIPGLMPDLTEPPSGCSFYDRCSKRINTCKNVFPEDSTTGSHTIKCHLYE